MKTRHAMMLGMLAGVLGTGILTAAYTERTNDTGLLASAQAQEASTEEPAVSPTMVRDRHRDVYYPNTEDLKPDEMRVVACGTGMPTTRAAQAAACFLVELGNGDKFLFDIGSGSAERISSLQIPYNFLDKVFIGHLHTDHFGDLIDLYVGGMIMGRNVPLRVWGPSSSIPELGTAAAMEAMQSMLLWDIAGRVGQTDTRGIKLEVTEFDYKAENQIVYEENGVVIRSFPAIHSIDGPVSYALEWNDLKFVFSSDTYPNKWFVEYARDADLVVHECFIAVPSLVDKLGFTPEAALQVGTQIHTAPEAFGKVMSEIEPRHAVAYHFFKDHDTTAEVYDRIRSTYEGPLSLAEDYMVWNVSKDEITERLAVVDHHTWSPPLAAPAIAPKLDEDRAAWSELSGVSVESMTYSDFISEGTWDVDDVLRPIYEEASEAMGQDFPYPNDQK